MTINDFNYYRTSRPPYAATVSDAEIIINLLGYPLCVVSVVRYFSIVSVPSLPIRYA